MRGEASDDFKHVLDVSLNLAAGLPGHVFIGGVAVYLHTVNHRTTQKYAEVSHDSDVMVSLVDLSVLRDQVEVVANRRLGKQQVIIDGVEIDVYVERQNNLAVPYDELLAHASNYNAEHVTMRAACPEHLLVLKLDACLSRRGSAKGDKDERDVVRLASLGSTFHPELCEPYLGDEHAAVLKQVARSRVFSAMCEYNDHEAKKLRQTFESFLRKNF